MTTPNQCDQPLIPVGMNRLGANGSQQNGNTYFPPWIYPPPQFDAVDQIGYVPIPAIGATAVVVTYTVQQGKNGIILAYANNYVGGGFQEGAGNLFWQILRNGQPIKFYDKILASLGTPQSPTRHPSGFRLLENDIIQITVTNVAIVVAGQLSGGRLMGWQYPKKFEDPRIWV